MTAQQRSADEMVNRMIQLAENKYNCSQIMMVLALEQEGRENPELVRAMSGLGDGCGFFQGNLRHHDRCRQHPGLVCRQGWRR